VVDDKLIKTLEFDKILNLSKSFCTSELAKEYFDDIVFSSDIDDLEKKLTQVVEMKNSLQSTSPLIINNYNDIRHFLEDLMIEGFVLSEDALKQINSVLKGIALIKYYFTPVRKELYPVLGQLSNEIDISVEIIEAINEILDEEGNIKATASPNLIKIGRAIRSKQIEINKIFDSIVADYKNRGLLSDTVETYRNGRRVLTLPVENKRKIRGIIHDESATGKTVYLEPERIIELNNDLFDFEIEYKKEIYKILRKISDQLRPYIDNVRMNLGLLIEYDTISAKARLAILMGAKKPFLYPHPLYYFKKAYHPLLLLKNKEQDIKTVSFDLQLTKGNRILVISGPNAGGKSITLKAVGLLQMMIQAGFLIPADENTKMGIFNKIFADIGDQQSLEDDLSTYSYRLNNMKEVLENADNRSLVLIDEFGSGTDPKIGGAIAEAMLKELHRLKAWAVITTHYTNIKIFAFKTRGIVNAAMHFDKEKLIPTYKLDVGKPGSSFAYEIAQNIGLSKKVLNYAKFKAGKNIKKIEELLVELQVDKAELQDKLLELKEKELKLDKLTRKYEDVYKDLDFKKKKFRIEKKEYSLTELSKQGREIQKLIREIRENQKLEKAKQLLKEIENKKKQIENEAAALNTEVSESTKTDWKDLKVGDYVKLKSGDISGKILKISKKKAEIETGNMKMTVALSDLKPSSKPIVLNPFAGIKTNISTGKSKFDSTIDIRGYSKAEALDSLQEFFDNALLANATLLKVLHGKGNGILRNAVKQIASEYDDVEELWHPPLDQGGDGITFVKLK
jgi:DNA mismatch repair protein MutS2